MRRWSLEACRMRSLIAQPALLPAQTAAAEPAADRIAVTEAVAMAARSGSRGRRPVTFFAELVGGAGFEALARLGAAAGLAALIAHAAVRVDIVGIALLAAGRAGKGRCRKCRHAEQRTGADTQP